MIDILANLLAVIVHYFVLGVVAVAAVVFAFSLAVRVFMAINDVPVAEKEDEDE